MIMARPPVCGWTADEQLSMMTSEMAPAVAMPGNVDAANALRQLDLFAYRYGAHACRHAARAFVRRMPRHHSKALAETVLTGYRLAYTAAALGGPENS